MGKVATAPPRVAGCAAAAGGCGRAGLVGALASQTGADAPCLQVESTWWRPCLSDQHATMCAKPARKTDLCSAPLQEVNEVALVGGGGMETSCCSQLPLCDACSC